MRLAARSGERDHPSERLEFRRSERGLSPARRECAGDHVSSIAPNTEKVVIDGPAGAIEVMVERPPEARGDIVAVCCHPHPLYGGTMQNKVVHTLARACQDQRVATVRFNFRGVGESAGTHDDGPGCGRSGSRSAGSSPTASRRRAQQARS
jgi:hypothetical protein